MNDAPPVLIAVVGGSGAGKGWFVEKLSRVLGERACQLQLDDFYRDLSHLPLARRARVNFDVPRAIDWDWAHRVLCECRAGQGTILPRYDFATHSRRPKTLEWEPRPIVIVDGLWLLRRRSVRDLFDLSIFLDTPQELRHRRRLERDVRERGYRAEEVAHRLRTAVAPMHARYVEPQKRHADVVLAQPFRDAEVAQLAHRLWEILNRAALVEPWARDSFESELLTQLAPHEYCH